MCFDYQLGFSCQSLLMTGLSCCMILRTLLTLRPRCLLCSNSRNILYPTFLVVELIQTFSILFSISPRFFDTTARAALPNNAWIFLATNFLFEITFLFKHLFNHEMRCLVDAYDVPNRPDGFPGNGDSFSSCERHSSVFDENKFEQLDS